MHIRHVVATTNFAGAEGYVASIAQELARRGHHIEVIGGDPQTMASLLTPHGVDAIAASDRKAVIKATARRPYPDLVHTHMTASDIAGIITRPIVRRPVVSTLHFAHPRGHGTLTRALYRAIPKLLSAQIAISVTAANAVNGQVDAIIPNGVAEPSGTRTQDRAHIVLVTQRLEPEKDTATVLRAFAKSGLATQGWELHICGEGSEQSTLNTLATTLGINHATRFFGRVVDVGNRMRHASLFVAPTPNESFGIAVVEAMACALPVIAANGGGHQETIGTATPETLFTPGDPGSAAQLLAQLAQNPQTRTELGAKARTRYQEAFTIGAHVDALETFYTGIVTKKTHNRTPRT